MGFDCPVANTRYRIGACHRALGSTVWAFDHEQAALIGLRDVVPAEFQRRWDISGEKALTIGYWSVLRSRESLDRVKLFES